MTNCIKYDEDASYFSVTINGLQVGKVKSKITKHMANVNVYAGDNYLPAADAEYNNLIWEEISGGINSFLTTQIHKLSKYRIFRTTRHRLPLSRQQHQHSWKGWSSNSWKCAQLGGMWSKVSRDVAREWNGGLQVLDMASWRCTPQVEIQVYDHERCNWQDWKHKYSVRKKGLLLKCSLHVA